MKGCRWVVAGGGARAGAGDWALCGPAVTSVTGRRVRTTYVRALCTPERVQGGILWMQPDSVSENRNISAIYFLEFAFLE